MSHLRLAATTAADREAAEAAALDFLAKAVWKRRRRAEDERFRRDPLSPWLSPDALRSYPELQSVQDHPEFQAVLEELRQG